MNQEREQMNVVIVGHVDHGKSTLIGRLLADTDTLPKGKLEAVKAMCERTAKPFEYAFLLDALKDEQAQGITIDTARSFFKSAKRDYIIIDAPGHIEFLKNMVTGAARAEAAILVIDAKEGIRENSKRHGYIMSFLGIKNIAICVNKMDLVGYDQKVFESIKTEYLKFLEEIKLVPMHFIPIAAREGDNLASRSKQMPWYKGMTIIEAVDSFKKAPALQERELRFPLQDIYKFTEEGDERRIFSGRIESGTIKVGDDVVFLPSNKRSKVKSVEGFNLPALKEAFAGQSTGVTLETQIYVKPGEILCKVADKLPHVNTKFKVNIFWMGKQPMVKSKTYKLKLASAQVPVVLSEIIGVLDATEVSSISNKSQVDRHDVAECVLESLKPVAFDEIGQISQTGRFVIVDNYEISGGGIVLAPVYEEDSAVKQYVKSREFSWDRSFITSELRENKWKHSSALVVLVGQAALDKKQVAKEVEKQLFEDGKNVYYLGVDNAKLTETSATADKTLRRLQHIQQLGEFAHVMTNAGLILITSFDDLDEHELAMLKSLNRPSKTIVINIGEPIFAKEQIDRAIVAKDEPSAAAEIQSFIATITEADPEFNI